MRRCSPCWCTPRNQLIAKIDKQYLPKLTAIEQDIKVARGKDRGIAEGRESRGPEAGARRQPREPAPGRRGAKGYRKYLLQQREQVARARQRATHDLRIADNTFETVEASFQLKNLMKDSAASFEAIQRLEAPTSIRSSRTRSCAASSRTSPASSTPPRAEGSQKGAAAHAKCAAVWHRLPWWRLSRSDGRWRRY